MIAFALIGRHSNACSRTRHSVRRRALLVASIYMGAASAWGRSSAKLPTPDAPEPERPRVIEVSTFGVRGDGVTDDTSAVKAAYVATERSCSNSSTELLFPAGRFMLSSQWQASISCNHNLAILGAGLGITTIVFKGTDGFGLQGTQKIGNLNFSVAGVSLLAAKPTSNLATTAVAVTSPTTTGLNVHFTARDVLIAGASSRQDLGWTIGYNLNTTVNAVLDNDLVLMPNYKSAGAEIGVRIEGTNAISNDFSVSTHVVHSTIQGGYAGISVGPYVQTVSLSDDVIIGNDFGIRWNGSTRTDVAENLQVTSSNFNALANDIWTRDVGENQITGNELLQLGDSTGWAAIEVNGGGYTSIVGNVVTGLPKSKAGSDGVVINNARGSSAAIAGNVITGLHGVCIVLSGTTTMVAAGDNVCNGPQITAPYRESNPGTNMLGSVSFNSFPAPVRFDGHHLDLLQPLAVPGRRGTSYIASDGDSGLHITSAGGSTGDLSVDGIVTARVHSVVTLPPCTVQNEGARSAVRDGSVGTFGADLGRKIGSFHVPVYCAGLKGWIVE